MGGGGGVGGGRGVSAFILFILFHRADDAPSDDEVGLEKKIVVWKFSQLDTNADDELSFKEIRSFRRMLKKIIKPRRCAKRFHRYCDKDSNRRIQKKEWTLCLWVDIKSKSDLFRSWEH